MMLHDSLLLLWTATWQSAILALLVFMIILILRDRLQPRWRYALWAIVLVRLAMPVIPSSPWGIFEKNSDEVAKQTTDVATEPLPVAPTTDNEQSPIHFDEPLESEPLDTDGENQETGFEAEPSLATVETDTDIASLEPQEATTWKTYAKRSVFIVWLCGTLCFVVRQLFGEYRFWQMKRFWKRVEAPAVLTLLESCRQKAGVRLRVGLYSLPGSLSAGSCGWLRPGILLSEKSLAQLSGEQLELVLMHEMIHHRRRDPLIQQIGSWLSVVHWFNPVVWIALRQISKYRETACDAAVLNLLHQNQQKEYAQIVLDFATDLPTTVQPIPGLVGDFSRKEIKRRIEMIVRYQKSRWHHIVLGASILLLAVMFGLTKADRDLVSTEKEEEKESSPVALKAELPDGGSVELLYARQYDPENEKFNPKKTNEKIAIEPWAPNGTSLPPQKIKRETCAFQSPWPEDKNSVLFTFQYKDSMRPSGAFTFSSKESLNRISYVSNGLNQCLSFSPKKIKHINLMTLRVPYGWQVVAKKCVTYTPPLSHNEIVATPPDNRKAIPASTLDNWVVSGPDFSPPREGCRGVNAWIRIRNKDIEPSKLPPLCVVFTDEDGNEYRGNLCQSSTPTDSGGTVLWFSHIFKENEKPQSIKTMRLEVQQYRIIEFRNIALYPGHKTKPEVKVLPGVFPKVPLEPKNPKVDLPGGGSVELLHIRKYEGKSESKETTAKPWSPNGTLLPSQQVVGMQGSMTPWPEDKNSVIFTFQHKNPRIKTPNMACVSSEMGHKLTSYPNDFCLFALHLPKEKKSIDLLQANTYLDDWRVAAKKHVKYIPTQKSHSKIPLSTEDAWVVSGPEFNPHDNNPSQVKAWIRVPKAMLESGKLSSGSLRIVFIDEDGNEYPSSGLGSSISRENATFQYSATINDKAKSFKSMRFEVRPYRIVEFKNLSLSPGHTTKPEVKVLPGVFPKVPMEPKSLKVKVPGGGSVEFLELRYCDPNEEEKTKVRMEHWSPAGVSLGLKTADGMSMKRLKWRKKLTPIRLAFQLNNLSSDWSHYAPEFEHQSPKIIDNNPNATSSIVTAFPEDKKQLNRIYFHCPKSNWQTISSEHVRYLSPQDTSTEKERIITGPEHGLKELNLRLSTEKNWLVSGPSIHHSHTYGDDIYEVYGELCIPNEMVQESKFSRQQTRLVFMDEKGKEYISENQGGSFLTKINLCRYSVLLHGKDAEAKAKSIKSMRLEVRPYRIVEFKNIALSPGHKTKPEVKVLPGVFPKVLLESKGTGESGEKRVTHKVNSNTISLKPLKAKLPGGGSVELLHIRKRGPKAMEKKANITVEPWSPSGTPLPSRQIGKELFGVRGPWQDNKNSAILTLKYQNQKIKKPFLSPRSTELDINFCGSSRDLYLLEAYFPEETKKIKHLNVYAFEGTLQAEAAWRAVASQCVEYITTPKSHESIPLSALDHLTVAGPDLDVSHRFDTNIFEVHARIRVPTAMLDSGEFAFESSRIIFIDKDGNEYKQTYGSLPPRNSSGFTVLQFSTTFQDHDKAKSIKSIRLEVRSYRIVEFKNLSLSPGHKTKPEVKVLPGVFPKVPLEPKVSDKDKEDPIVQEIKTLFQQAQKAVASVKSPTTGRSKLYKAWRDYKEVRQLFTTHKDLPAVKQLGFTVEEVAFAEAKAAAQISFAQSGVSALRFLAKQKKTKKPVSYYARECAKVAMGSDVRRYFNKYAEEQEAREKGQKPSREYVKKSYPIGDLVNPLPGSTVAPYYRVMDAPSESYKIVITSCPLDSKNLKKEIVDSFIDALRFSTYTPDSSPWRVRKGPKPSIKFVAKTDSLEIVHNEAMHKTLEERFKWIRRYGNKKMATVTLHFAELAPEEAGIKFDPEKPLILSAEELKKYRQKCKEEKKSWKSLTPVSLHLGQHCTILDPALEEFIVPKKKDGAWPCFYITKYHDKNSKDKDEAMTPFFGFTSYAKQRSLPGHMNAAGGKMKKGSALLRNMSEMFSKHAKKADSYVLLEISWDEVKVSPEK